MLSDIKKRASHRAKIIEGQIKGLHKAVDNEAYCIDIITQSLAIQRSLRSLNKLILENHLQTHVKHGMETGSSKEQEELIAELIQLYDLSNVRG